MRWLLCSCFILWASVADAASVIESFDRVEINWSTLRFRFYGEAASNASQDESLKADEKKAWQDGIAYLQGVVPKIIAAAREPQDSAVQGFDSALRETSKTLVKTTSSFNTVYFADGTVRVILENQLPKALPTHAIRFRQREPVPYGVLEHSGIGFRVSKPIKPSARYVVVDESGETLFDVHMMAEGAYRKNLMGRWLKRPSPSEVTETIGKNPALLDVEVVGEAMFRVSRAAWEQVIEGHRALIVNGVVAVILP